MVRYSQEHKAQTHEKILEAAARLFRRNGFKATGVDNVMKEAGLTHGGFYAHFDSKESLFSEAFSKVWEQASSYYSFNGENPRGLAWLRRLAKRYLSSRHRDNIEEGCPISALISELPNISVEARKSFETEILKSVSEIEQRLPKNQNFSRNERAWATVSLMVGSLALSRGMRDPKLSEKILKAGRKLMVPEDFVSAEELNSPETDS